MQELISFMKLSLIATVFVAHVGAGAQQRKKIERQTPLIYINTLFENGSPLHWDIRPDRTILISLMYDHANWIEGLQKVPLGRDWELLGRQLHDVFYEYFSAE